MDCPRRRKRTRTMQERTTWDNEVRGDILVVKPSVESATGIVVSLEERHGGFSVF